MTHQVLSRVDKFLAEMTGKPVSRGSLIFALDATASREKTWDLASHLQVQMFREVAILGSLDVQLVFFRGTQGTNAECKSSGWVTNPLQLANSMAKIRCEAGLTQIRRVLAHAVSEAGTRKASALVYIGDSVEETRDQLIAPAGELARLGIPAFLFQEGYDQQAELLFREIAGITRGAYCRFDQASAKQLADLLKAVAAFAVGGIAALHGSGSDAARLLLGQIR